MNLARASVLLSSVVTLLLNSCAPLEKKAYTPAEMTVELDQRVSPEIRDQIVVPFEIDDEIRDLFAALGG